MASRQGIAGVVLALAPVLAGCDLETVNNRSRLNPPKQDSASTREAAEAEYLNRTAIKEETASPSESAVDTALQWAQKYADVSERLSVTQRENRDLRKQNQELTGQVASLKDRLSRSENELAEANKMLMELQKELGQWKRNVLGYRNEMRQASQAEMEALIKILTLLGGEVPKDASPPATMPASVEKSGENQNEST